MPFPARVSTVAFLLVIDRRRLDHGFDCSAFAANVIRDAEMTDRKAYGNSYFVARHKNRLFAGRFDNAGQLSGG
jgi:hypothetical protein